MTKTMVQSDRTRPRAIELMKDAYASEYARHLNDPAYCGVPPEKCSTMADLKREIEEQEKLLEAQGNFPRSYGLK